MKPKIAVIGGGPAGLFAAISAAAHGAHVVLFERNNKLGIKVLMSGGGRCNITNTGDVQHLVDSFPGNGRFLRHAFHVLSNRDVLRLLAEEGVSTHVEDRGRVFPDSGKARDVVAAWERRARRLGVEIRLNAYVECIERDAGTGLFTVHVAGGRPMQADRVIIATGGVTYPTAGTTGDGYRWARQFGHTIIAPRPALVALETVETWPASVKGVALRNIWVFVRTEGNTWAKEPGDLLFTHFGVSGPAVLNASRQAVLALEARQGAPVTLAIRLEEKSSLDKWDARLRAEIEQKPLQLAKNLVTPWWPASLASVLFPLAGVDPECRSAHLPRADRLKIAGLLHELVLHVKRPRPMETAMVTSGGVDVREVNPKTMGSKLVPGLYFAGEVLDVDGISGGYNLQGAYSTGWLAGRSAALGEQ